MKHKIVLELSTPELDEVLSCIEATLCSAVLDRRQRLKRGAALMDAALDAETSEPWSVLCLNRPYRALVNHWPHEDTVPAAGGWCEEDQVRAVEMAMRIRTAAAPQRGLEVTT